MPKVHGGTITTCISDDAGNCTVPRIEIELYYPPIKHYLLVVEAKQDKVKLWAAGLGSGTSFKCHVDYNNNEGVSALYHNIVSWGLALTLSLIAWFIAFWIGYVCYKDSQRDQTPSRDFSSAV